MALSDKPEVIAIPKELAMELYGEILSFMNHHKPCFYSTNYICEFCGVRAMNNRSLVVHRPGCDGERYLKTLKGK
jgi:hypothetical protein